MAGGSSKFIILALFANLGIAIAKLVVALITHSGAMIAESIHSFADSGNQALLLLGEKRSVRPEDENHPLGYGREAYFWALLVAVMLFTLGGVYSCYEGIHKLLEPTSLNKPQWALGVLLLGMGLEGYSLRAAWLEYKRVSPNTGLFRWARSTGKINLLVVVFEDLAAMLGLGIAFIAISLAWITGNPIFDAVGTLVLGVLLLVVAIFLVSQVRRLIVGFSAGPEIRDGMMEIWERRGFSVLRLSALWCGPDQILVVGKVVPRDLEVPRDQLIEALDDADREVYRRYPEVRFHFVEPDLDGDDPADRA